MRPLSVKSNLNERSPPLSLGWFATRAGRSVLAAELGSPGAVIAAQGALPWLWLGIPQVEPPDAPYGVVLRRIVEPLSCPIQNVTDEGCHVSEFPLNMAGFDGSVRCDLPLPFASESFGTMLIQHALDDGRDWHAVLSECERLLLPGGVLWFACINPWSPYRLRSLRHNVHAQSAAKWQRQLLAAGFERATMSLQWCGPHWRVKQRHPEYTSSFDGLRASLIVTARKRTLARIRGLPAKSRLRMVPAHARNSTAVDKLAL